MVTLANLRFLYSFMYSKHIYHIHVLGLLLLPFPSHVCLPLVWPMSHNIAVFVLGLQSAYKGEHEALGFTNFTKMA
jgi:hypothetical protein